MFHWLLGGWSSPKSRNGMNLYTSDHSPDICNDFGICLSFLPHHSTYEGFAVHFFREGEISDASLVCKGNLFYLNLYTSSGKDRDVNSSFVFHAFLSGAHKPIPVSQETTGSQ